MLCTHESRRSVESLRALGNVVVRGFGRLGQSPDERARLLFLRGHNYKSKKALRHSMTNETVSFKPLLLNLSAFRLLSCFERRP